jgi:hypothetical protein
MSAAHRCSTTLPAAFLWCMASSVGMDQMAVDWTFKTVPLSLVCCDGMATLRRFCLKDSRAFEFILARALMGGLAFGHVLCGVRAIFLLFVVTWHRTCPCPLSNSTLQRGLAPCVISPLCSLSCGRSLDYVARGGHWLAAVNRVDLRLKINVHRLCPVVIRGCECGFYRCLPPFVAVDPLVCASSAFFEDV